MSAFEAMMLVCFGAAWPISIYKSWNARTAVGKSLLFQVAVAIGYVFGIIHKVLFSNDFVLYLYIFNLAMIIVDTGFWFRNRKFDKRRICLSTELPCSDTDVS